MIGFILRSKTLIGSGSQFRKMTSPPAALQRGIAAARSHILRLKSTAPPKSPAATYARWSVALPSPRILNFESTASAAGMSALSDGLWIPISVSGPGSSAQTRARRPPGPPPRAARAPPPPPVVHAEPRPAVHQDAPA